MTLRVDADDADASGYEPIWHDGTLAGFVTSGGYGHSLGQSLAMGLVDVSLAAPGTKLKSHIVGVERPVEIIRASPWDPSGVRMRS